MKDSDVFPSFIAVDFWESSDVVQVVDMINSNFYVANYSWLAGFPLMSPRSVKHSVLGI